MDLYNQVSQATSKYLTKRYSTSFGLATGLLDKPLRPHIYNIYGLVRLADEIVDTYGGDDASKLLNELEQEVYDAMARNYSANIIVHAFAATATRFGITKELIGPFFDSMRIDAPDGIYEPSDYKDYIYGSAEVVGLMCLRVFCDGNNAQYDQLKTGALALGSAFQKTNFLRDLADDHRTLDRYYFPTGSYETFDDQIKNSIIADIEHDFSVAQPAIKALPSSARLAVAAATNTYKELLRRLSATPASVIRQQRVRVPNGKKFYIIAKALARSKANA